MAILVKNLSSLNLTNSNSLLNQYLYSTDISTGRDSKIRLQDVFKQYRSIGKGTSIIQDQTIKTLTLRSLSISGNILNITSTTGAINFSITESNIDLNKCKNTTSLFLSTVNLATNVAATILPTANGGTNRSSAWVVGDIAYASATDGLGSITAAAVNNVLLSGGAGTIPAYGKVGLTTHVSGALPPANGGTGNTSVTSNSVLIGNGTGNMTPSNASVAGQILIGSSAGVPAFANLSSSDSTVVVTNGNNTINLSSRVSKLELSDGTDMLVASGTNVSTSAGKTFNYQRHVTNITTATKSVTAAETGTLFTLSRAAGIAITLPAAVAGYVYEFHIMDTFTGTCSITAASSADTYTGCVKSMDKDGKGTVVHLNEAITTSGWNIPNVDDYILTLDADTDGRFLGGSLKFTAISASKWHIEGTLFNDGTVSHIFS